MKKILKFVGSAAGLVVVLGLVALFLTALSVLVGVLGAGIVAGYELVRS